VSVSPGSRRCAFLHRRATSDCEEWCGKRPFGLRTAAHPAPRPRDTLKSGAPSLQHLPFAAKIAAARHTPFAGRICRQLAPRRVPLYRQLARLTWAISCPSGGRVGHGRDGPLPATEMESLPCRCSPPALCRPHDPRWNRSSPCCAVGASVHFARRGAQSLAARVRPPAIHTANGPFRRVAWAECRFSRRFVLRRIHLLPTARVEIEMHRRKQC